MAPRGRSVLSLVIMKPGMQRDILIAFRMLFDEFILDDDELEAAVASAEAAMKRAKEADEAAKTK